MLVLVSKWVLAEPAAREHKTHHAQSTCNVIHSARKKNLEGLKPGVVQLANGRSFFGPEYSGLPDNGKLASFQRIIA